MMTSGTASPSRLVERLVLDHRRDADPLVGQARARRPPARPAGRRPAAAGRTGSAPRSAGSTAIRARSPRPQPQRRERPLRPADGQVDQVGDARRWPSASAPAPGRSRACSPTASPTTRMALYAPRTWASRSVCRSSTGDDVQGHAGRRRQPGLGQQLDRVARVRWRSGCPSASRPVDAAALDRVGRRGDAEGDLRQDRELVGGVGAVHVERRVGLGVAELLGLGQRRRRSSRPRSAHRREDEVARAVEDALDRR